MYDEAGQPLVNGCKGFGFGVQVQG